MTLDEKITQATERANRAYLNDCYWMDYMTPQGMPCNRSMLAAREQLRSAESELRELKLEKAQA